MFLESKECSVSIAWPLFMACMGDITFTQTDELSVNDLSDQSHPTCSENHNIRNKALNNIPRTAASLIIVVPG